ncbi:MAG: zf-HC2 domain-containing protein [Terracidiphilus sp.]|jgi:hypothetical protein
MKPTAQHEFHPDAERLNAFSEQALPERERAEVLAHLAVCGRCRQVVALARETAETEVETASAAPREAARPKPWWRSWGLVLAPATALAATAVVTIVVHVRNVEQRAEVAKIESQNAERNPAVVAAPAQPRFAEETPAPPAPEAKAKQAPGGGGAPGERARAIAAQAQVGAKYVEPYEGAAGRMLSDREQQGVAREAAAGAEAPAASASAPAIAEFEEQRRKVESETAERHLIAAKAAAPPRARDSESGAESSAEQVTVTAEAPAVETQSVPATNYAAFTRPSPGAFPVARATHSIRLPSGLPTVSVTMAGHVLLAIDNAGTLFVSEDSGATWEPVAKQWTGRAVSVRKQAVAGGNTEAAPEAKAGSTGSAAGAGVASSPPVTFEILNDQGLVWASADGKTWIAQ